MENKQQKQPDFDVFSAAVPGESLTKTPGGSPYEKPPQFSDFMEATEYMFDKLVEERQSARVITLLRKGATCEGIARTLLFVGFTQGKWTPDVVLLMARPVLYIVAAIAERAKSNGLLKKYTILNPDYEQDDFLSSVGDIADAYSDVSDSEVTAVEAQLDKKPLGIQQEEVISPPAGLMAPSTLGGE